MMGWLSVVATPVATVAGNLVASGVSLVPSPKRRHDAYPDNRPLSSIDKR